LHALAVVRHRYNLFVRRMRLINGGHVAKRVTFFVETDAPNLGRTINGTHISPGVIVQDAFATVDAAAALSIAPPAGGRT
jgi:hypothetical protein